MRRLSINLLAICLTLVLGLWSSHAMGKTYMVSIGISDYPGEVNDLTLPARDAQTMKWLFEKNQDAETILITDQQATVANIVSQLKAHLAKSTSDDTVVMFYSGHGNKGQLECYDGKLYYKTLWDILKNVRAKNKFIFINACFSGSVRYKYSDIVNKDENIVFFTSSRTGEPTLELMLMRNGLFPAYLVRGLKGGADVNRDRAVTARELFDFVSKGVRGKSEDKQHPTMWGRYSDDLVIMKW